MSIVISVLHGDSSYYTEIDSSRTFRVGMNPINDFVIPDLGFDLEVCPNNGFFQIEISNKQGKRSVEARVNESTVIDYDQKIAVYISESFGEPTYVQMPSDCKIHVGKSDKVSSDGSRNEIVLDYSFVSRNHFSIVRENGETRVVDNNSTNGLFLNGRRISSAKIKSGDILSIFTIRFVVVGNRLRIENACDHIKINQIKEPKKPDNRRAAPLSSDSKLEAQFIRAPRLVPGIEKENITLERPPQAAGAPQINWLNVLVTPFVSVGLMVILVLVMGMNAVMLIMSGVMSVVSAIIAITTYNSQKKQHGETDRKIKEKYRAYLKSVSAQIENAHKNQLQSMIASNPPPTECAQIVKNRGRQLWERRPSDSDFLVVRLGTGTVAAAVVANFQRQQVIIEENVLEAEAEELAKNSVTISNAPVLCNLLVQRQSGIIGKRDDELLLLRNIIAELTTLHAYDELKIVALIPEQEKEKWLWLRWLPHCMDNQREKHYIFTSPEDTEETFGEFEEVFAHRKAEQTDYLGNDSAGTMPHYLFIIAAPSWIEKSSIRKYIFSDSEIGCSSLFVYNKFNSLPKECSQIIELSDCNGLLYNRTSTSSKIQFKMDWFELDSAERFARSMAPIFTETEQVATTIPTCVSFLEGYHVSTPEQLANCCNCGWSDIQL